MGLNMKKGSTNATEQSLTNVSRTGQELISEWSEFVNNGSLIGFKKGQILFYKGHFPYGVFVLLSGRVKLVHETEARVEEIYYLLKNEPFGLDLIVLDQEYPCVAIAEEDTKVLFIPKSLLQQKGIGK